MHTKRIIPCLDVKDGKVVKGINFKGLINVGDPVELGKYYYEAGADELVFLDVTATHEGRGIMEKVVDKTVCAKRRIFNNQLLYDFKKSPVKKRSFAYS